MKEIQVLLNEMINEKLERIILSNPMDPEQGSKVKVRPVLLKGQLCFQETLYRGKQVFHCNCTAEEIKERLLSYIEKNFKQAEMTSSECVATVLISKKGKITIKKKYMAGSGRKQKDDANTGMENEEFRLSTLQHNRSKKYILEEGKPVNFLVGLGVQTPDGKIVKARYDKFRQINRYLEFIEDILKKLPTDRPVRIIDFGCGKSYLTFAMYYYLHELKGYEVRVTGLDLKEDVIDLCNKLAGEYGYEYLQFEKGDISTYEGAQAVDMVVTLHACDTATDYAMYKAVQWGAKVILAVPCCQHEVNRQIACDELKQILKYGLIKERISALITDAVRANLLEEMGYETQILEFIDMEHTPKNLLIRAVRKDGFRPKNGDIRRTTEFLHVETTLQKLFKEETEG
ncbi:MAG: SAM-dependent methyltransferase [Lachnospiraceae bacterium]|nr:SAM-dependent methyltransferase [Lachnospiraceae bacterium]